MRRACGVHWEGLIELAEGRENPSARAHADTCESCKQSLSELRQMMGAASLETHSAPKSLIDAVIGLMPKRAPLRAGLLRTTLGLAGARSDADDFQIVVSLGNEEARLMYLRDVAGWEVIGKLPEGKERVERDGAPLELGDGRRFSFRAVDLGDTSFTVVSASDVIEIPSAEDLLSSGS